MQDDLGRHCGVPPMQGSGTNGPVRRVDLVVTEYQTTPRTRADAGTQTEYRWTIPVAVLIGDPVDDRTPELTKDRNASGQEGFLRALEDFLASLRPQRDRAFFPEENLHLCTPASVGTPPAADAASPRTSGHRLTPRERQVLEHVLAGHRNKETAAALSISRRTVEHHRASVMQKSGAHSVPELMRIVAQDSGSQS